MTKAVINILSFNFLVEAFCNWKWSNEEDWKLLQKNKTQDVYYSLDHIVYYKAPFSKRKIYSLYIYILLKS